METGIYDINGIEVQLNDCLLLPNQERVEGFDEVVKVVFDHGAFGYYTETRFIPLNKWQETEEGEYIPNEGRRIIYTKKYPFLVDMSERLNFNELNRSLKILHVTIKGLEDDVISFSDTLTKSQLSDMKADIIKLKLEFISKVNQ